MLKTCLLESLLHLCMNTNIQLYLPTPFLSVVSHVLLQILRNRTCISSRESGKGHPYSLILRYKHNQEMLREYFPDMNMQEGVPRNPHFSKAIKK